LHHKDAKNTEAFPGRIFRSILLCVLGVFVGNTRSGAQEAATTYTEHVLPILQNHCLGCHNADKKKGDLDLSTYSASMAGGGSGDVVAAGDSGASSLYKVVAHLAEPKMPPKKAKIADGEIAVIKKWIDGGLIEAPGGKAQKSKGPKVDLTLKIPAAGKPAGPAPMPEDLLLEPEVRTTKAESVTALAASPWGAVAAVGSQHQVVLYNTDTLEVAGILPFPERRPTIVRFSRSGALLLAAGGRGAQLGRVVLWDVKTGDRVTEIGEEFDQVLAADLSPDQTLVALGGPGKLVKIYSTKDGDLLHSIKKHTDWVTAMEFSPDGAFLATGDRGGGLHIWEGRTGRILHTLTGHKAAITDLSWRADSAFLASSSEDGQVIVWESKGATKVKGWAAHPATASVKYAMDGRLVTCGRDMIVRTWDGQGTKLKDFEAFSDLALRAVFTHDGARVLAGDWTGEIRVWSAADAKRIGHLSTNPPTLAERMAAESKALAEAKAAVRPLEGAALAEKTRTEVLDVRLKSAGESLAKNKAELAGAEPAAAEADKAFKAASQAVASAQSDLAARQNESGQKNDAAKKAEKTALKAAEEKDPEAPKLAEIAQKARAEADLAANAMGPAQKALAERQDALKQATEAKAAADAKVAQAKAAMEEAAKEQASLQKQVEDSLSATTKAKQALDAANVQLAAAQHRVDALKAAQFNVQVWAAKRELAKIQAELDALGAKGEDARRAAADAEAKAKAGEQAVPVAQAAIKKAQDALAQAKTAPAKTEAALEAARKTLAEREARAAAADTVAKQLAEEAKKTPDDATAAEAAKKAKETLDVLQKGVAEAKAAVAARGADHEKAKAAIPAAEKAIVDAKAAADQAAKKAVELKVAARAAAEKIGPEQAPIEAFRPKLEAAKAKVEALKAEYLKLKPKSL
jgi:hypothetical protein